MKILKQSTAAVISFGPFLDKTDGVTLEVGAGIITSIDHATTGIFLSKNGGAGAIRHQAVTASVLDAYGMFLVTLDTTDTNTVGRLRVMMAEAATFLPVWDDYFVLPANVYDSLVGADLLDVNCAQWLGTAILAPGTAGTPDVNAKLIGALAVPSGAVPNAVAGAAGGIFIAGTNAATTITTAGGSALTLTSSGANGHGLSCAGNGSGDGIHSVGGATGDGLGVVGGTNGHGIDATGVGTGSGINAAGGATNGQGMLLTGTGTGDGLRATAAGGAGIRGTGVGAFPGIAATGGAASHGILATGGATSGIGISAVGTGTGAGISATGGATGPGILATGGGNNADADGVRAVAGGALANGIESDRLNLSGAATITGGIAANITGNLSGTTGGHAVGTDFTAVEKTSIATYTGYSMGAVWFDTAGAAGAVSYVNGIQTNPCSNPANTHTLLVNLNLKAIRVVNASSFTVDQGYTGISFLGEKWTLVLNGQALNNCYVEGATVSGVATGTGNQFTECQIGTVTMNAGGTQVSACTLRFCGLNGTFTIGAAGIFTFEGCYNETAAAGVWILDFAAVGATTVRLAGFSGSVEARNMAAGDVLVVEGGGAVTLAATCAAGAVYIRGSFEMTNASAITPTDSSRWNEDQSMAAIVGAVGSVTGAVGSVTGNVGGSVASVVGAVGSVTGNVGGSVASVVGAVGSVTGAVGSVTGNVGGNVVGTTGGHAVGVDLTAVEKASVNAEVVDALSVDTIPELGVAVPGSTPTPYQALMLPYMALRNKLTTTATAKTLFNDAGAAIAHKDLADDGATYTEAEMQAGA